MRFASPTSTRVSKKLESFAKQIRKLIDENIFEGIETISESEYQLPGSVIRDTIGEELPSKINSRQAKQGLVGQEVEAPIGPTEKPQLLYAPIEQAENHAHSPQRVTILLHSTSDRERDKRRIKLIYGTLISFYGRDKFTFQLFHDGKRHLIDFPNDTTRVCPELLTKLKKILGEESWLIEEIKFR